MQRWFVPLLLFLAAPAGAATLSGFVRDAESRESLSHATVIVRRDALTTGALTNNEGYYAVPGLAPGTYLVSWNYVGYETGRDTLIVVDGVDVRRDIELQPAPLEIPEIDVSADRQEKIASLQPGFIGLEAKALRRIPSIGEQDIIRSLQLLPGIQAASDVSSGLYIRGGGPDQTLILLDQITLYNPTHAFGFFSTFNPDAIKDVNLYKGAYPAQYGGRLGSVLDVSNRAGNQKAFEGHGGVSLIAARATLEGPVERGSWILSARRTYLDPFLDAMRKGGEEIPEYYFYDVNGRINRSFGTSDNVILSGYAGNDDLLLDLDEGSFVDIQWGNLAGTAKWTHVFAPRLFGNFLLAGSRYHSDTEVSFFETPGFFRNNLLDLTAKADLDFRASPKHQLTGGLIASRYRFEFSQGFNFETNSKILQRPYSTAGYIQDEWILSPRFTLQPGIHLRYFSEGSSWRAEPRISFRDQIRPDWRIKVGGGLYSQYLQLISTEGFSGSDLWVPLDQSVDPGTSWQVVAGVEHEPSEARSYSLETYYTDLSDLVAIDTRVAADQGSVRSNDIFLTGGTGWAAGLELFLQQRTGPMTGWIGYTLGYSRRNFDELNQGATFPPKYDRRHDIKFVLSWDRGPWTYNADFVYATGQAFTPAGARYQIRNPGTGQIQNDDFLLPADRNSGRLLPFHRFDVGATRQAHFFGLEGEWFFQVYNLYNRRNEWFIQYDTENAKAKPEVVKQLPVIPTLGVNFEF